MQAFLRFCYWRCRFDSGFDFKGVFGWISKNSTDFECDLYCFHSGRTYFGIWQTKEVQEAETEAAEEDAGVAYGDEEVYQKAAKQLASFQQKKSART